MNGNGLTVRGRLDPQVTVEVMTQGEVQAGKYFLSTGAYYYSSYNSSGKTAGNVFTAIHQGVLRVLNVREKTVRLLNTDMQFLAQVPYDPVIDA